MRGGGLGPPDGAHEDASTYPSSCQRMESDPQGQTPPGEARPADIEEGRRDSLS